MPQHCLSSEEKIIDDEFMELRTGSSSNHSWQKSPSITYVPIKQDVTKLPTHCGELGGNANQWKQKVKIFAVKIMSVRGRSVTADLTFILVT